MNWPLARCRVVGGMRPADGKAPFARGAAVLSHGDVEGRFLLVRGYTHDGVDGDELDLEEWQGLQDSGQALRFEHAMPVDAYSALWVLRPGFVSREELLRALSQSKAVLGSESVGLSGSTAAVVREDIGNPIRDRFALEHFEKAWKYAQKAQWSDALRHADLSFVLSRGLVVERVALLALAMEREGRKTGADGLVEMAAGSRGPMFGQQIQDRWREFAQQCAAAANPLHGSLPSSLRNGPAIYKARNRGLFQNEQRVS